MEYEFLEKESSSLKITEKRKKRILEVLAHRQQKGINQRLETVSDLFDEMLEAYDQTLTFDETKQKDYANDYLEKTMGRIEEMTSRRDVEFAKQYRTILNAINLGLIVHGSSLEAVAMGKKQYYHDNSTIQRPKEFINCETDEEWINATFEYNRNMLKIKTEHIDCCEKVVEDLMKEEDSMAETTEEEDKQFYQENKQ